MPDWYAGGGIPANRAPGESLPIREQFADIATSFGKLPVLTGNAGRMIRVNSSGTGLEAAAEAGSAAVASSAEVTAGTNNTKIVTPQALRNGEVLARNITTDTSGAMRVDVLSEEEYADLDPVPDNTIFIIE